MNKYFEIVPISEKPPQDGWYTIVDPENPYSPESCYFLEGDWFESEVDARENENHFSLDVDGCSWLRPLTSLPIDRDKAEKIWSEAVKATKDNTSVDVPGFEIVYDEYDLNNAKETYLKQFE